MSCARSLSVASGPTLALASVYLAWNRSVVQVLGLPRGRRTTMGSVLASARTAAQAARRSSAVLAEASSSERSDNASRAAHSVVLARSAIAVTSASLPSGLAHAAPEHVCDPRGWQSTRPDLALLALGRARRARPPREHFSHRVLVPGSQLVSQGRPTVSIARPLVGR